MKHETSHVTIREKWKNLRTDPREK